MQETMKAGMDKGSEMSLQGLQCRASKVRIAPWGLLQQYKDYQRIMIVGINQVSTLFHHSLSRLRPPPHKSI